MLDLRERPTPYRLAFDVGGTFTDVVLVDGDGVLTIEKVLTTPDAPEVGAEVGTESALAKVSAGVGDVGLGVHGTTLVANAIIERRGARTGLLTTQGRAPWSGRVPRRPRRSRG